MEELFTKRYEPKTLKEIKGQEKAIQDLHTFIKSKKKTCAILYGPTGSGKTSSVYKLAQELDHEILEVNASDFRNAEAIRTIVGAAANQRSLFSAGKIILVDDIDGLSGKEDRGGISELLKVIDESPVPIICTALSVFDQEYSTLRRKSALIEFETPSPAVIYDLLKHVCEKENIHHDEETLKQLARQSGGDIRAALTDLQTLAGYTKKLLKEDVVALPSRNKLESVPQALVKIFKGTDLKIANTAFDTVDEDLDKLKLWVDENLPSEYKKPEDLERAYHYVSMADVFNRRIRRWQHWRFMIYISSFLSAGVAVSKDEKNKDFIQYKPTSRILKLWMANQKYAKRKAIAQKIHEKLHASVKETVKSTIPYLQLIFKHNKHAAEALTHELGLDAEEAGWLKESAPKTI